MRELLPLLLASPPSPGLLAGADLHIGSLNTFVASTGTEPRRIEI